MYRWVCTKDSNRPESWTETSSKKNLENYLYVLERRNHNPPKLSQKTPLRSQKSLFFSQGLLEASAVGGDGNGSPAEHLHLQHHAHRYVHQLLALQKALCKKRGATVEESRTHLRNAIKNTPVKPPV